MGLTRAGPLVDARAVRGAPRPWTSSSERSARAEGWEGGSRLPGRRPPPSSRPSPPTRRPPPPPHNAAPIHSHNCRKDHNVHYSGTRRTHGADRHLFAAQKDPWPVGSAAAGTAMGRSRRTEERRGGPGGGRRRRRRRGKKTTCYADASHSWIRDARHRRFGLAGYRFRVIAAVGLFTVNKGHS